MGRAWLGCAALTRQTPAIIHVRRPFLAFRMKTCWRRRACLDALPEEKARRARVGRGFCAQAHVRRRGLGDELGGAGRRGRGVVAIVVWPRPPRAQPIPAREPRPRFHSPRLRLSLSLSAPSRYPLASVANGSLRILLGDRLRSLKQWHRMKENSSLEGSVLTPMSRIWSSCSPPTETLQKWLW
ncbi:Hypothetical predicted protein [Podarcis lilfordi]|uniref:Uncharacterized protein n=1 Tax=Podarcis lilfordi TaxID=74358 RepID=A0AA35LHW4_9SAUR|nr:Hypothetical predicted protein [Podarcis lilfordi]